MFGPEGPIYKYSAKYKSSIQARCEMDEKRIDGVARSERGFHCGFVRGHKFVCDPCEETNYHEEGYAIVEAIAQGFVYYEFGTIHEPSYSAVITIQLAKFKF